MPSIPTRATNCRKYSWHLDEENIVKIAAAFTPDEQQVDRLVARHPFAQVVSYADGQLAATPLPLLLERRAGGQTILLGHFSRANPQVAQLESCPYALVIFLGPHGYVSPSWFRDRTQAPTWNYATVHFTVRVEMLPGDDAASASVSRLSAAMERGRSRAWQPAEMGPRYPQLLPHIVAFRAHVLQTQAKFKLGQNERIDVLADALAGMQDVGADELLAMMQEANRPRLGLIGS